MSSNSMMYGLIAAVLLLSITALPGTAQAGGYGYFGHQYGYQPGYYGSHISNIHRHHYGRQQHYGHHGYYGGHRYRGYYQHYRPHYGYRSYGYYKPHYGYGYRSYGHSYPRSRASITYGIRIH